MDFQISDYLSDKIDNYVFNNMTEQDIEHAKDAVWDNEIDTAEMLEFLIRNKDFRWELFDEKIKAKLRKTFFDYAYKHDENFREKFIDFIEDTIEYMSPESFCRGCGLFDTIDNAIKNSIEEKSQQSNRIKIGESKNFFKRKKYVK